MLFYVFSIIAIYSALMVILSRNPLTSALYLILCFFAIAGFYVILNMEFLAAMQVLVYAGAIMVLVVLVIMLLNLANARNIPKDFHQAVIAVASFVLIFFEIFLYITKGAERIPTGIYTAALIKKIGNTQVIGELLFTKYIFPFEVVSVLLFVAIVGAFILAKRKL